MSDYEQMEIDVRLESEKDLKTNVGKVIKFFYDKRRMEAEESGWPLKQVKGKHEGYGIAAEAFSKIGAKMKALDRGMKDYLALLQVKGEDGVSICDAILLRVSRRTPEDIVCRYAGLSNGYFVTTTMDGQSENKYRQSSIETCYRIKEPEKMPPQTLKGAGREAADTAAQDAAAPLMAPGA